MGFLEFIFGAKKRQVKNFLNRNAIILDVRTNKEYNSGHIKDSLHIPLNDLHNNVDRLKAYNKPFIVCCQSGIRSAKASKFLNLNNIEATNGGGWISLKTKL
ncbi:rhodanese-like domain-containing protein [Aurantibacter sp.]|uniref:rhodanese-like domain-containing protein n=1 Tax=Aurantibacter sp. TaxID=2807103 RepID=UPI0035C83C8F